MEQNKMGAAAVQGPILGRLSRLVGIVAMTVCLALSGSVGSAIAADFDDGWRAYQAGDFATALKVWDELAAKGDARAQFNIGVLYDDGLGVAENTPTAIGWWQKAAANGHKQAQHNLGLAYLFGRSVERDYPKAVSYFRSAADAGLDKSQYNLGKMYLSGFGVPKDVNEGFKWIERPQ